MERIPYRKTHEIVGYTYDAAMHSTTCARRRFGDLVTFEGNEGIDPAYPLLDREGNPVDNIHNSRANEYTTRDRIGPCCG